MARIRDSQRSKLYKAERILQAGHREMSLPEVKDYVREVTTSEWWTREVGRGIRLRVPDVRDGRGRRRAAAFGHAYITMPRWSRIEPVILHELAHIGISHLSRRSAPVADHGREFAGLLVKLVDRFMGRQDGALLRTSFKNAGVRYKPKRQLSPETLAAMRERGRALAACRRKSP